MLRIESISKTFYPGTVNERRALDRLSLILPDGDFAAIVGSNGAGKSTLFNAIAGSFLTDSGFIELDGEDITFRPEHLRSREIGRLFQDPLMGTAPHMSIEENLSVAYLRASGSFFQQSGEKGKGAFPGAAFPPQYGAGGPDGSAGGASLRRTATGFDPSHGDDGDAEASPSG